jgi:E3 ubiquitin-protein ligase TRIP12
MENLEEYVDLVVQQHLVTGVEVQLKAFKSGFDQVFPLSNLAVFMVDELESLLCGTEDSKWDMQSNDRSTLLCFTHTIHCSTVGQHSL